ncbi:uncharacterized protein [Ptychodera flava]|uniref:uncharacterized protein n=1 Tax=Ptychodera flava TaxID=63121 RepID=UPI003969D294
MASTGTSPVFGPSQKKRHRLDLEKREAKKSRLDSQNDKSKKQESKLSLNNNSSSTSYCSSTMLGVPAPPKAQNSSTGNQQRAGKQNRDSSCNRNTSGSSIGSRSNSISSNNNSSSNNTTTTTINNNSTLLLIILKTVKNIQSKVDRILEEQERMKATIMKLSKHQSKVFEVRKGSYEYNTLIQLLAKMYFTNPLREVPRQEIYDEIQNTFSEYNANCVQKMMKFCRLKVQEWRQEEVRKVMAVEDDRRHYCAMDTCSLAETICHTKLINVTPKIVFCLALIRKFNRDKDPERKGFGSPTKTGSMHQAGNCHMNVLK